MGTDATLLGAAAAVNLLLGAYLFRGSKRSKAKLYFAIYLLLVALWEICMSALRAWPEGSSPYDYISSFVFSTSFLASAGLFGFSLHFYGVEGRRMLMAWTPAIIMSITAFIWPTPATFQEDVGWVLPPENIDGTYFAVGMVVFAGYLIGAVIALGYVIIKVWQPELASRLKLVFLGSFLYFMTLFIYLLQPSGLVLALVQIVAGAIIWQGLGK